MPHLSPPPHPRRSPRELARTAFAMVFRRPPLYVPRSAPMRVALALALPAFCASALARVGSRATDDTPRAREREAPLEIELARHCGPLRRVAARSGDRELALLFDTGGGATVLDAATARALGCTSFGRGTGFRHDGARVDGARGTPIALELGAFHRRGEIGVLDLAPLLGGLPEGLPRLDGIASLETFAGATLSIDLARERLIVECASSLEQRIRGGRELRVRVAHQAAGASLDVFVALDGRHGPLWFELDSGCTTSVLVAPHAFAELGLDPPSDARPRRVALPLSGYGAIECEIESRELIYDGVLNTAFFERHVVTLDLAHARGWLRANDAAETADHDARRAERAAASR